MPESTPEYSHFSFNGVEYSLLYDYNSLADAEDITHVNHNAAIRNLLSDRLSATELRALLYAFALPAHPKLTLTAAGKLINLSTVADITKALGEACVITLGDEYAEKWRNEMLGPVQPDADTPSPASRTEFAVPEGDGLLAPALATS